MRPYLLALAWFAWDISNTQAVDVKGSIGWNHVCPGIDELHPQTKVILDGGKYRASIRKDGHFTFLNVTHGSYLLEVLARDHVFDQIRVDVLPSQEPVPIPVPQDDDSSSEVPLPVAQPDVEVRPVPPGTPFAPVPENPLLTYPIVLQAQRRKVYFVPRQGFDALSMFKNPMMIMMLFAGGMVFLLPKAMENMDPELVKDMTARQDRIFSMQNKIQNGDYSAITAELLSAGSASASNGQPPSPSSAGTKKIPTTQSSASTPSSGKKGTSGGGKKKR